MKGTKVNAISALEVIERKQFGFGVKDLIVFDIFPKLIIYFIFKIEFELKLWISSLGFRVVSKKVHKVSLVELALRFFNRIQSVIVFFLPIASVFHQ